MTGPSSRQLLSCTRCDQKITVIFKFRGLHMFDYICRITIKEVADDVGISFDSCQAIFTQFLGMKRAAARIVPELLNFQQK